MKSTTAYLSKLIGITLIITALAVLQRHAFWVILAQSMLSSAALIFLCGFIAFILGLALVLAHNHWSSGAPGESAITTVLITLLGWLTLFKGLALLFLPAGGSNFVFGGAIQYAALYYLYCIITLIIGIYLTISGFRAKST